MEKLILPKEKLIYFIAKNVFPELNICGKGITSFGKEKVTLGKLSGGFIKLSTIINQTGIVLIVEILHQKKRPDHSSLLYSKLIFLLSNIHCLLPLFPPCLLPLFSPASCRFFLLQLLLF